MDDLLALMEERGEETAPPEGAVDSWLISTQREQHSQNVTPELKGDDNTKQVKKKKTPAHTAEAQVDSLLKIRMLDRKVGSLDLLEFIEARNYHSPAALAGMSRAALSELLIEPVPSSSPGTVFGNTNLVTIGLVFTNSGTKIAAKGNAFCVVTIGSTMNTGPTVSVLLFGPAYSKYCKEVTPGLIVGLDNPRLIPPKPPSLNGSKFVDTTVVSFSISDERRLFVVAKARDYGICQATVRGKNAEGHWINSARRCNAAIDTRAGKYCHRHQGQQDNKLNKDIAKNGTFIQQQRQRVSACPNRPEGIVALPNNRNALELSTSVSGRLGGVPMQMSKLIASHCREGFQPAKASHVKLGANHRKTSNGILNASRQEPRADGLARILPTRYEHHKLATNGLLNGRARSCNATLPKAHEIKPANAIKNGIAQSNQDMAASSHMTKERNNGKPCSNTITQCTVKAVHNWLPSATGKRQRVSQSSSTIRPNTTKLNTVAMGGFDGRVAIPKPCSLFASRGGAAKHAPNPSSLQLVARPQQSKVDLLAKQSEVAKQMRDSTSSPGINKIFNSHNHNSKKGGATQQSKSVAADSTGFFGSSLVRGNFAIQKHELNQEAVIHAKSRFASEADAEAYAESRHRLTELEQEEARKSKSNQKNEQPQKVVDREWICRTCHKKSNKEPKICIRSKHEVVVKRILNKAEETLADKRTKLTSKSAQDGGLVLGSGIEWHQFK
jgi:hypothetical protein